MVSHYYEYLESVGLLMPVDMSTGFVLGFCVGGGLFVLLYAWARIRMTAKAGRCDGVTVESDTGSLFISANAIREFITRIVSEFEEASVHSIVLRNRGETLRVRLRLEVLPETVVQPLSEELRSRIITRSDEQLGIEQPIQVDIDIRSLSAKAGRIARQRRRARTATESQSSFQTAPAPPSSPPPATGYVPEPSDQDADELFQ